VTDRREVGGGGLTGATGDLTPEGTDEAFDPGERREVEDPVHAGEVTSAQIRHAAAQSGEVGDPEALPEGGGQSGYGSEHGLNPQDPAYQFDRDPTPGDADADEASSPPGRETRLGGDERSDAEDHF
jgi:hypothetical protein